MKVLFYSLYANFLPPFGTQLELMQEEKDSGNELFVVHCTGKLSSCHANLQHHPVKCARCVERSRYFFQLLDIPAANIFALETPENLSLPEWPKFHHTDDLLYYEYKGYQLGRGVASTLISRSRELEIDSDKYGELIDMYLRMAIESFEALQEIIQRVQPDKIYVYNGRQPEDRPMILLAEKLGIPFVSYVSGSNIQKYRTFENGVVHYLHSFQQHINALLEIHQSNMENVEKQGAEWFDRISGNTITEIPDYTRLQQKGMLPDGFDASKRNIAIFNSSEDEMKTFEDWKTPLYKDQNDGIRKICAAFSSQPDFHFYLRIHPNLKNVNNSQMTELRGMQLPNLTVILPESAVSTYTLMDTCEKVITFGSSTGAEATHRGKVSILVGKSFYDHLDCVYKIEDYDHLMALLSDKNLPPKPALNARKYGFYLANHGNEHRFLEFKSDGHYFKGQRLEKLRPKLLIHLIQKLGTETARWLKVRSLIRKYGI